MHFAALDRDPHERKRHQVFQAAEHRGLLDPDGEILHRLVVALLDLLAGLDEHRHPFADEVAGRQRRDLSMKARMPPHCAWPSTTMCFTRNTRTAYSSAAETPWASASG